MRMTESVDSHGTVTVTLQSHNVVGRGVCTLNHFGTDQGL